MLKSALNYLNSPQSGNGMEVFPGSIIALDDELTVKCEKLLGEGGFAFVYQVQNTQNNHKMALKRLLASDKDKQKAILKGNKGFTGFTVGLYGFRVIWWWNLELFERVCGLLLRV